MAAQLRSRHATEVHSLLDEFPVVALAGARQVGKSTLAGLIAEDWRGATHRFDLEDPRDLARLDDPMLALAGLQGLILLDEIQRTPDLFPILRVLADRPDTPARFLVLGSAGPELLRQTSESLAGRVAFHTLDGFDMEELGTGALERLWLRGGFPRAALATNDAAAMRWLGSFCATFLERDLPQLGVRVPAPTMQRFWQMLAHWHGNVWSGAEFARAIGVGEHAVRRYLDLLASALVVRVLPPWHANSAKRQVRSPKVYVRDSGVLHSLLDLPRMDALLRHPKVGASWEGFLLTQVIALLQVPPERCWFWATHAGAELDLLVQHRGRRLGFEFKRTTTPRVTPSMRAALTDLGLERLDVVHAGTTTWDMAERVRVVAAQDLVAVLGAEGRA